VWRVALDHPPVETAALRRVLSGTERRRADQFRFEHDRLRYEAARGALRIMLGRYLATDPALVVFAYGPRGKPRLEGHAGLHFNVSHSGGLALLAFARRPLGIDVEHERDLPDAGEIAERFFSPREAERLRALPPSERRAAFFRCWTRKEAWIKATGEGLAQPLDSFDVSFATGEPPGLERVAGQPGEAERWWLADLRPAPGWAGALAMRGEPSALRTWDWEQAGGDGNGARRERGQDDLQGRPQPRGAVLDLAR
jgi:4'-phosphopantetheinyl transferase